MQQNLIVFTDMDGTLLDHHSYSFEAAQPALERCQQLGIPVIPVTSKTRAELRPLMQQLGLTGPFIVENGAGVYIPKHYFSQQPAHTTEVDDFWCYAQVPPREKWLTLLEKLSVTFPGAFTHFAKMGVAGVQLATDLPVQAAELALAREFGEPVQWLGAAAMQQQFIAACESHGARVLKGGRFLHVAGKSDKGAAVQWLCEAFVGALGVRPETMGLGDSHNDVAMLNVVDHPVIIRGVNSAGIKLDRPESDIYRTEAWGPAGWQGAVSALLDAREVKSSQTVMAQEKAPTVKKKP